jgi:hypothetical protein
LIIGKESTHIVLHTGAAASPDLIPSFFLALLDATATGMATAVHLSGHGQDTPTEWRR